MSGMLQRRCFMATCAGAALAGCEAAAQLRSAPAKPSDYLGQRAYPSIVSEQLKRLGDRVHGPGKERLVLSGGLTEAAGPEAPAQLIYQLPLRFRFQKPGAIVTFDGENARSSKAQVDTADEELLESFVADSAEGFFDALSRGAALRLLGRGFRPDPRAVPDYRGTLLDIFELGGPVVVRRNHPGRNKRFYFDSATGLLSRVRYVDSSRGPQSTIETRFSEWREVAGSAVPGAVERLEDARRRFLFRVSGAELQPRGDEGIFRDAR